MKRELNFLGLCLIMFFTTLTVGLTQAQEVNQVVVPGSTGDVLLNPELWFASTGSVAGLTIFIVIQIMRYVKNIHKFWKQLIVHFVSMLLVVLGNLINIGFMANFKFVPTLVYGIIIGFIANGLYDLKSISTVQISSTKSE